MQISSLRFGATLVVAPGTTPPRDFGRMQNAVEALPHTLELRYHVRPGDKLHPPVQHVDVYRVTSNKPRFPFFKPKREEMLVRNFVSHPPDQQHAEPPETFLHRVVESLNKHH